MLRNPYATRKVASRRVKHQYVKIRTGKPARVVRPYLKQQLLREVIRITSEGETA